MNASAWAPGPEFPPADTRTSRTPWAKQHERCVDCLRTDRKHQAHGLCFTCWSRSVYVTDHRRPPGSPWTRLAPGQWAEHYAACTACGTTSKPHTGKGVCTKCRSRANRAEAAQAKHEAPAPAQTVEEPLVAMAEPVPAKRPERRYCWNCGSGALTLDEPTGTLRICTVTCMLCSREQRFTVQLGSLPAPEPPPAPSDAPEPDPWPWTAEYAACQDCGTTRRAHHARGLCTTCSERTRRHQWTARGRWSTNHERCVRCGTTDSRYEGRGLCTTCYHQTRPERRQLAAQEAAP